MLHTATALLNGKRLRILDLELDGILGDAGAQTLACVLHSCPWLHTLTLSMVGAAVGDDGFVAVMTACSALSRLSWLSLDVRTNNITAAAFIALRPLLCVLDCLRIDGSNNAVQHANDVHHIAQCMRCERHTPLREMHVKIGRAHV